MYRSDSTILTQYNFSKKKYLANASVAAAQTQVGVVTKPLNGYVVFMLDYLDFAIDTEIDNNSLGLILDYAITES